MKMEQARIESLGGIKINWRDTWGRVKEGPLGKEGRDVETKYGYSLKLVKHELKI